ncbi:hypothetical protein QAD02_019716 [Eretmocerus hayati]|uniref:Uncharacterized protein n=1 Tax=Eretmocerus hayati TaxID=131215 RepID=A0ACC2PKX1_9HYME|nr:hypothetical protein QAD02_019716 [Eretmocerus hayati]
MACFRNNGMAVRHFAERGFSLQSYATFLSTKWPGYTPLHFAIKGAAFASSVVLSQFDVDLCAKNDRGWTPLHLAYRLPSVPDILHFLNKKWFSDLQKDGFANPDDGHGLTHFHISCTNDVHLNVAQFYLDHGVDVNLSVFDDHDQFPGYTPLHFAVHHLCAQIVDLLLARGASVSKVDKTGSTPVHLACQNFQTHPKSRISVIDTLLRHGANLDLQNLDGMTPLHYAFYGLTSTRGDLIQMLLSRLPSGVNRTDSAGLSYFHIACSRNEPELVLKFLTSSGSVDVRVNADAQNYAGYTGLHFAVRFNKPRVVQVLLDRGADVNAVMGDSRLTPLHLACLHDSTRYNEVIGLSRFTFENINWQPHRNDHLEIVRMLLRRGASVDCQDSSGSTPLARLGEISIHNIIDRVPYRCTRCALRDALLEEIGIRQKAIAEMLLAHGANVRARSGKDGSSILHAICRQYPSSERRKLAEFLLMRGADVRAINNSGIAPIHAAVRQFMRETCDSGAELIELFLDFGADINCRTSDLRTPLHLAVEDLRSSTVLSEGFKIKKLLEVDDVEIDAKNEAGDTPLHLAIAGHKESAISLLLQYGADINIENNAGHPPIFYYGSFLAGFSHDRYLTSGSSKTLNHLVTHIMRLKALGAKLSQKVDEFFSKMTLCYPKLKTLLDAQIGEEIEKLKSIKIDGYSSLFDILSKNPSSMIKHVKNETLETVIMDPQFQTNFSHFSQMLILNFKRGKIRSEIVESAKISFNSITGLNLPESCAECIFKYLGNLSLKNIVQSTNFLPNPLKRKLDQGEMNQELKIKVPRLDN